MYSHHVVKIIKGRKYVYDQMSYRRTGRVRTVAKYVGPLEDVHYQWRRTWS